jgi:hypothetical protein
MPEIREKCVNSAFDPVASTPEDFQARSRPTRPPEFPALLERAGVRWVG